MRTAEILKKGENRLRGRASSLTAQNVSDD